MTFDPARYRPAGDHLELGPAFFDPARPAVFPRLDVRFRNQPAADKLGLGGLSEAGWQAHFGRFEPLPDSLPQPLALKYHGDQFRHYNPDLGDGRGFLFAQLRDPDDGRLLDLGTKGSGTTAYSRGGDGRLTLKGGVREVLATAMLDALGVETSRSFSLIETGEALQRQDEPSPTRSAVLVRLSHGHIRFGTFQRLAYHQDRDSMERLIAYVLPRYFGQLPEPLGTPGAQASWLFEQVVARTARLAARWFAAGFVHGVLNTDNMNITGESFDYGPYRFLPTFDPGFVAAYFDHMGLYAFGRQPQALSWNLQRLAQSLLLVEADGDALLTSLQGFAPQFEQQAVAALLWRLGLQPQDEQANAALITAALAVLTETGIGFDDFFFRARGHRPWEGERPAATAAFLDQRRAFTPLRSSSAYFERPAPVRLLYDDIERLWLPIVRDDDWRLFEETLQAIEELRLALLPAQQDEGRCTAAPSN